MDRQYVKYIIGIYVCVCVCVCVCVLILLNHTEEAEVERFYEELQDLLELTHQKDVLCIIGDWSAKVGNQETAGVTGKFGLGVQNEAGQS